MELTVIIKQMASTKMLQILIDGQAVIRKELIDLKKDLKSGFESVTKRIDKLGYQLARVEDDTPTVEEHDNLEKRVTKIEKQLPRVN